MTTNNNEDRVFTLDEIREMIPCEDKGDYLMGNIVECAYNIDNGCVEASLADGTMLRVEYEEIQDSLRTSRYSWSKQQWLLDNELKEYFAMAVSGELQSYCKIEDDYVNGAFERVVQEFMKRGDNRATAEMFAREFFMYES